MLHNIFPDSSVVERMTVNHDITGSSPVQGANYYNIYFRYSIIIKNF